MPNSLELEMASVLQKEKERKVKQISENTLAKLIMQTEKEFGGGKKPVIQRADQIEEMWRVSTGFPEFDNMLRMKDKDGNWSESGIATGRMYEFFGPYSVGKSSFVYKMMSLFSHTLFIDAELTFDPMLAELHGANLETVYKLTPKSAEHALQLTYKWANAGIPLIVIDSVPAMATVDAWDKIDEFEKEARIAGLPRLFSQKLPLIAQACYHNDTILIFINQIRANMVNGSKYNPHDTPGGHALRHWMSGRFQVARKGFINDTNLGDIGQISKIRIVKSKISPPRGEAEFPLMFDRGFVTHEEVPDIIDELRVAAGGRAKRKKKSEEEGPFTGGQLQEVDDDPIPLRYANPDEE
jgi:RecA/RadA recombinase